MQKRYELWLDESGTFQNEKQLKSENKYASLIGGLLVEKEEVEKIDFNDLLNGSIGHATDMCRADKKSVILPILETMQNKYNAKQVFFENALYEDENTNRQLYLRMMAEGLLQLIQTLNAKNESVKLKVIIARRQDVQTEFAKREIKPREYTQELKRCIELKRKEHKLFLDADTQLEFEISVACETQELMLADYACNTRLTRDSYAFKNVKTRLNKLYKDAYLFTLYEVGSLNYIKIALTKGDISDAIFELFTSNDELNINSMMGLVLDQIKGMSNRLLDTQIKMCVAELIAYTSKTDDYEVSEALLKRYRDEFIPYLQENNLPIARLHFSILLQLAEVFLREGDIDAARDTLHSCRDILGELGGVLEDLPIYYQLVQKEAFLAIKEFDYEKAVNIMDRLIKSMEGIMHYVEVEHNLTKQFANIRSKSYADIIATKVQAMIYLQRDNPKSYTKLCELSNLAMAQYRENSFRNELEIHRRYRSRIEMEAGNYISAVEFLMKARRCQQIAVDKVGICNFLESVSKIREKERAQYYIMDYLMIMVHAKHHKNNIADLMYENIVKYSVLLRYVEILDEKSIGDNDINSIELDEVQEKITDNYYHPIEILNWKMASYLYLSGNYKRANHFYRRVIEMCCKNENYYTMYVVGIGIHAEYISCLAAMEEFDLARGEYYELKKKIEIVKDKEIVQATRNFVEELERKLDEALEDNALIADKLWEVSVMIN